MKIKNCKQKKLWRAGNKILRVAISGSYICRWFYFIKKYVLMCILNISVIAIQLTLKQHECELHGSTYTQVFFDKHLYCFWSEVESLWVQRPYCMHWSTPFFIGDLSICTFLYPEGVLEPTPTRVLRYNLSFRESKVICGFSIALEAVPLTPMLFKGLLCIICVI